MFFNENELVKLMKLFENIKYIPGSYRHINEGYRTAEVFEVEVFDFNENKWNEPIQFRIVKEPLEKSFFVFYRDYGFRYLDPNRECLKLLRYLFGMLETHPKSRILLSIFGWIIDTTPNLLFDMKYHN